MRDHIAAEMKKPKGKQSLAERFDKVPWTYRGRQTPLAKLARSLVPIGNKSGVDTYGPLTSLAIQNPEFEESSIEVEGTAFQVSVGMFMTCAHLSKVLRIAEQEAFLVGNTRIGDAEAQYWYPIDHYLEFVDPVSSGPNDAMDMSILVCAVRHTEDSPYIVPNINWGDSTKLGIGDRVVIGGYALGKDMFFSTETNRGLFQPSFFDCIVSSIIPAIQLGEPRLLQLSSVALGGISGGVVADPKNGNVLGMVISGLSKGEDEVDLPVTYAIPSEVLQPWVESFFPNGRHETIASLKVNLQPKPQPKP